MLKYLYHTEEHWAAGGNFSPWLYQVIAISSQVPLSNPVICMEVTEPSLCSLILLLCLLWSSTANHWKFLCRFYSNQDLLPSAQEFSVVTQHGCVTAMMLECPSPLRLFLSMQMSCLVDMFFFFFLHSLFLLFSISSFCMLSFLYRLISDLSSTSSPSLCFSCTVHHTANHQVFLKILDI